MFAERRKVSSTVRLAYTAWADDGSLVTGLTPLFRVIRESDGYLLDSADGLFRAVPASEYAMAELDATNAPGRYYKEWALPATADESYAVIVDAGATVANRHADCRIEAIAVAEADLALTGGDGDTLETLSDQLDSAATATNVTDAVSALAGEDSDTLESLSDQIDDIPADSDNAAALLAALLDGTTTVGKALQVLLATCCGKATPDGNDVTYCALDGTGTTARLKVTLGTNDGQRTAAEIDPT